MSKTFTKTWSRWLLVALIATLPAFAVTAQGLERELGPVAAVWNWVEDAVGEWLANLFGAVEISGGSEPLGQEAGPTGEPCGLESPVQSSLTCDQPDRHAAGEPAPDGQEIGPSGEPCG